MEKIITMSSDENQLKTEHIFINKMNILLIHILKHEWPSKWPTFISDLVAASKTSEELCENNIAILKLMSEEIYEFSKDSIVSTKAEELKTTMKNEFAQIFDLIEFILENSDRSSLIIETLQCLQRFVTWIPEEYIFETELLSTLCAKFLSVPAYREHTLLALTEVASLEKPDYSEAFVNLYIAVIQEIVRVIPGHENIHEQFRKGSTVHKNFIRHLALFFATYFKSHAYLLESEEMRPLLMKGMEYLVKISDIDDQEIFKICLEYWLQIANDLYSLEIQYSPGLASLLSSSDNTTNNNSISNNRNMNSDPNRKEIYSEILSAVRTIMINHMAKPEEILIETDSNGEVVRETVKDTEALATYKVMKDTLVFLTHLDPADTERIMLEKLATQVDNPKWQWDALSTLCWAIGSISGTMAEVEEKRFLVTVIKDLLGMCEKVKGKNNKAVVASNIMYVVGQYPRFLRAHWKFLKTVVWKLFEFMHEKHPGVQDMAVDTFLKIATKCKKKFVVQQLPDQPQSFIQELCPQLAAITADLEYYQVLVFFEAAGQMVSAHPDESGRHALTEKLLETQNHAWERIIRNAASNVRSLQNTETLREIRQILRINTAACKNIGPQFDSQLGLMYLDMLNIHKTLSNMIREAVNTRGDMIVQSTEVKAMRIVKKEILTLVGAFVSVAEDTRFVAAHFIPPLLDPVLEDYATSSPSARDAEVLNLMSEIINKLQGAISDEVPKIFEAIFEPTLEMITENFVDNPDHRINFFKLLEAINSHCFSVIFEIPEDQTKLVLDSIVWAFSHTGQDVAETGLNILENLLGNVYSAGNNDLLQQFYLAFYLELMKNLLGVLTDRQHKANFKQHATIIRTLCHAIESGKIVAPLWESPTATEDGSAKAFEEYLQEAAKENNGNVPSDLATNQVFVRAFIRDLIGTQFTNLSEIQVDNFVEGLFDLSKDVKSYKAHLRDFLIQVLEFRSDEGGVEGLFAEEQALKAAEDKERRMNVPGLEQPRIDSDYPLELQDDDEDI